MTLNASGTFSYDPNGAFDALNSGESATDGFDYTWTDPHGLSDTATVTVTINGAGAAPVANDDAFTVHEDQTAVGLDALADNGSGAGSDADGDALTVSEMNGSAAAIGTLVTLPSGAAVRMYSDGTFNYTTQGAFNDLAVASVVPAHVREGAENV